MKAINININIDTKGFDKYKKPIRKYEKYLIFLFLKSLLLNEINAIGKNKFITASPIKEFINK